MVRIGFGRNAYRWFARIDLWWFYLRLQRKPREVPEWLKETSWDYTERPDGLYALKVHTATPDARFAPGDRPKE